MIQVNNLYNIDCIEGLKQVESDSIDLIVTSPPYNVGIDYDTYSDNLDWQDYLDWCKQWLTECYRVLKDDGRICINHYIAFTLSGSTQDNCKFPLFDIRQIMTDVGYQVKKLTIWNDGTRKRFTAWGSYLSASAPNILTPYEGILIACKKQWNKKEKGISTISKDEFLEGVSGVWNIGTTTGLTKCCFPEKLPHICINLLSYLGDTILDPFSGSGTTCCVAKKLGRNYIGFELSENYHNVAITRLCNTPQCDGKINDNYLKNDIL